MKLIATLGLFLLIQLGALSQSTMKNDVILKTSGDELTGKVQEIGDTDVKFVYAGETLVYQIKKTEIAKITFSSGRVEMYNSPKPSSAQADSIAKSGLEAHQNKIAILPFNYLINKQDAGQEMTYKVQNEVFNVMNSHSGYMSVQPTATTNALLLKAGITGGNVRSFTMGEICNVLGVEYVIQGTITQDLTSVSSSTSGSTTYSAKTNSSSNRSVGTVSGGSSSYSAQNYSTNVTMTIYTDKGETIFSQDHQSFWSSNDAYKTTLNYLLKRTPIYQK
ncbi:hypothetical protein [Fluviicola sp.]|uniref:hypothetical protein n=1 Tax=Fluviicola sp. TaxID=1917219 RepID=UPI003D2A9272